MLGHLPIGLQNVRIAGTVIQAQRLLRCPAVYIVKGFSAARSEPRGTFNSSTITVMMTVSTPSLKASSLFSSMAGS